MSISYSLTRQKSKDLIDEEDRGDTREYASEAELKNGVREYFTNFKCLTCGSSKVDGSRIEVRYGKVHYYKEEPYKSIFGGVKHKGSVYKIVWRIHEIGLKPGVKRGMLSRDTPPGEIYCKEEGCPWQIVAPMYPEKSGANWYPLSDIKNAIKFWF